MALPDGRYDVGREATVRVVGGVAVSYDGQSGITWQGVAEECERRAAKLLERARQMEELARLARSRGEERKETP
ncbi:MAG TPA: hypothetical protein VD948_03640 [Rhodothermales bacterium]|nr:hypothetical protein [Rhodothermales bacterium]